MAENQIKWRKSDYITLGRAVSNFNKKINALNAEGQKLYLPENITYQETKQNITSRRELNRVINSLKRFSREGAEELYTTQAGEQMTKWERKELGIQSRIAQVRLKKELATLETPTVEGGYSRAQMGSIRAREIEAQIKALQGIEQKAGEAFKRLTGRIKYLGVSDWSLRKATIYRENYLKAIESISGFKNYDILLQKLKSISNPISFFEFIQQNEILSDLFIWYDDETGTLVYGGFASNEDAFDNALEQIGII